MSCRSSIRTSLLLAYCLAVTGVLLGFRLLDTPSLEPRRPEQDCGCGRFIANCEDKAASWPEIGCLPSVSLFSNRGLGGLSTCIASCGWTTPMISAESLHRKKYGWP
ncbi:uncharacterized protein LOC142575029 isoform X1 [Dermacentor variabilis]|uniref:uncharacterized protein LOC142575029 isoform X1 n=1 Tax=Dermacentor variabilis TaxID=34621 RepID=UPI003F5C3DEA